MNTNTSVLYIFYFWDDRTGMTYARQMGFMLFIIFKLIYCNDIM